MHSKGMMSARTGKARCERRVSLTGAIMDVINPYPRLLLYNP